MMRRRLFFLTFLAFFFWALSTPVQAKIQDKPKAPPEAVKTAAAPGTVKTTTTADSKKTPVKSIKAKKSTKMTAKTPPHGGEQGDAYVVKKGDSLHQIAKRTGVPVRDLQAYNSLQSQKLRPGQRLALCPPKTVVAKKGVEEELDELDNDGEDVLDLVNENDFAEAEIDPNVSNEPLGKWTSTREKELFIRVVKGFLGTPYRIGGSSVRGIDCSAFVQKIYELFEITLPRTAKEQSRVGLVVSRDDLAAGDLVFFNTRRAYGHVGIYIGNNLFIHASSKDRSVKVDSLESTYFSKRFVRAVRLKGADDGV